MIPSNLRHKQRAWLTLALAVALVAGLVLSAYDWPEFGFNSSHSGNNSQESLITTANVSTLQRYLHVALPDVADGAPAYLSAAATISGTLNLLFVTTKDGHILALDAATGATVWSHQNGPNGCLIKQYPSPCYTTSSPAIDPSGLFVYSYGLDGYVHKYQVSDGTEIMVLGWPELATRKGDVEKGSSALSLATAKSGTSYLYVTNGGYPGDFGDYQGHVTAINLATGTQNVFNAMCSDQTVHFVESGLPDCAAGVQSAIWARAGVVYDPDTDKIYMATGNGTYDPANHLWGDTVFSLNPDGTGASGNPLDTYTPTNYQYLQDNDVDIGSTAPAILPNSGKYPHLALQAGKDSVLRLLNLDNLSGQGGPGFTGGEVFSMTLPQGNEVLTAPAVWVNPSDSSTWAFVADDSGLSGLKLAPGGPANPSLSAQWTVSVAGTSPIVANGVLYLAGSTGIYAFNPVTGVQLWHDGSLGGSHWESPIVANGTLFITDESNYLSGYALSGTPPTPTHTPRVSSTPTRTPAASHTPTMTATPTRTATATQTSASSDTPTTTATPTETSTPTQTPTPPKIVRKYYKYLPFIKIQFTTP